MADLAKIKYRVLQEYEMVGYAICRDVLDADKVREVSDHVDWLCRKHPDLRPEHLHHHLMANDSFWVGLVGDDRLLNIAELFIGPNIALFASHYISKPPEDGQPVLWHQDGSYWPLDPMEVTTLWLAVDDATPKNGCMRVIPASHKTDLQKMNRRTDVANVLSSEIDSEFVEEGKAVDIKLKAGDVSVHHPNLIHGSNPNTSANRRCGLTIRYIPTSTRITSEEPWPTAFLLRGEAVAGVNEYVERPRG
jgi:ectoine hydroxylase-related dioxygenase (phytanoyl-CoA dioxygenase family)